MWIIGVDYHPSVQQIAFVNTDTGECGERRLNHSDGEAEKFYRELKAAGCSVRVGMEASGHARSFFVSFVNILSATDPLQHSLAPLIGWIRVNPYDVIMSSCQRRMTLFSMHASKQSSLARLPMETCRSATNCRPKTTSLHDSGSAVSPFVGLFRIL